MFSDDYYDIRNTAGYVLNRADERFKRFFKEEKERRRSMERLSDEYGRLKREFDCCAGLNGGKVPDEDALP